MNTFKNLTDNGTSFGVSQFHWLLNFLESLIFKGDVILFWDTRNIVFVTLSALWLRFAELIAWIMIYVFYNRLLLISIIPAYMSRCSSLYIATDSKRVWVSDSCRIKNSSVHYSEKISDLRKNANFNQKHSWIEDSYSFSPVHCTMGTGAGWITGLKHWTCWESSH